MAERVVKLSDISRKDFTVAAGKLSVKSSSAIARSNDGSGNLVLFNPSDPLAGWMMPTNVKDKGTIFVQFSNGIAAFEYISSIWYFRFFQPNAANTVIVSGDANNSITPGSDGGAFFDASGLGGGGGAVSSVTGTIPAGKQIAVHNNGIGGSTIIRETVTTLVAAGQDVTYLNENGVSTVFKQAIQYNTGEVRNGSVGDTSLVIQNGAVVEAKIGAGAVTETKIGNGAVTNAKLAPATAHSIKSNSTASAASPTDLVINELELVGRSPGASVDGIGLDSNFTISGGQLQFRGHITSLTYSALAILISSNQLIQGRKYLINDYQTVHTIPGTADTNTGPIEPLIVTAISNNDLEPIAYSTLHPNDIIYYTPTNGSISFPGSTKGYITRRIDTENNNDIGTDWRYCKYRRYKITEATWSAATTYDARDVVKSTTDNFIYVSRVDNNLNNPVTNENFWILIPVYNGAYAGVTSTGWILDGVKITTDPLDFQDYTFFAASVFPVNNYIQTYELMNTVLFVQVCQNNTIGRFFLNNSVCDIPDGGSPADFSYNKIGDFFSNNLLGRVRNNTIGNFFRDNIVGNGFTLNRIESNFEDNIIGINFQNNYIYSFIKNIIVKVFYNNRIDAAFIENNIGAYFFSNDFTGDNGAGIKWLFVPSSTISGGFQNNSIGALSGTSLLVPYNFTGATFVFSAAKTEIYKRLDGTFRLRYTNNSDTIVVVSPNA